jgi:hypothetical protein
VIDFGCGVGTWLRAFTENGVTDIHGLDGAYVKNSQLEILAEQFSAVDLTKIGPSMRKYDVALCLEVAEHLPSSAAENLIDALTGSSDIIVFSAAIPHQPGTDHINCRPQSYWARLFAKRGFSPIDCLRSQIWDNEVVEYYYGQNTIVYVKGSQPEYSKIPLDLVHPTLLDLTTREIGLRKIISQLPKAIFRAVKHRIPSAWTSGRSS